MIGAIIGDIVGSRFEFDNIKTKDFELFDRECMFTDDTVMTIAIGKALCDYRGEDFKTHLVKTMHEVGNKYLNCGYGGRFLDWMKHRSTMPYNSCGNGSAMRVSAVGWYAKTLEEAEVLATLTAEVTHNHPEGIKGAVSIAGAIWLARNGKTKDEIKKYIVDNYYALDFTLDEIRPTYDYEITCQKSVPQAIQAFLESENFEDAIRNAISIGGDSDTVAAITGSIAEAFYGVDEEIRETALSYLDDYLLSIYEEVKIDQDYKYLAEEVESFLYEYDTYEYRNVEVDREEVVRQIKTQLNDLTTFQRVSEILHNKDLSQDEMFDELSKLLFV